MIDKFVILTDRMNLFNAVNRVAEFADEKAYPYITDEESETLMKLCDKVLSGISDEMSELIKK